MTIQTVRPAVHHPHQRWTHLPKTLHNGDRLSLAEFKHLYANSPKVRRAELIEGVVYVASPVYLPHSISQMQVVTWLGIYHSKTPNTQASGEQSVELDGENEVQPDALLWVDGEVEDVDGLLVGAPALVVEVAVSTRSYDLGTKKRVYRRNRIQEYLVLSVHEQKVFWFRWDGGAYIEIEPDEHGVYKSSVFPGLWLDSAAFWQRDVDTLITTLKQGLITSEHKLFIETLAQ